MYQGASSSTSNALQLPSFQWEEGHPARYTIAVHLTKGAFSAKTIVEIDSCFTQAVYRQQSEKHDESRVHHMQTLHVDNVKLEGDAERAIYQAYQDSKDTLLRIFENPSESLGMAKQLADQVFSNVLAVGEGGRCARMVGGIFTKFKQVVYRQQVHYRLHAGYQPGFTH